MPLAQQIKIPLIEQPYDALTALLHPVISPLMVYSLQPEIALFIPLKTPEIEPDDALNIPELPEMMPLMTHPFPSRTA